jgi:glycosyltransferase involved in cell wall biosynthesis
MTTQQEQYPYTPLPQPMRITEQHWPEGTVPLVSITCITYNHVNFIRDAIEGFLMQETTFPVEILIHDDASTDGTADIVREYETQYPQLIRPIYQTENQYSQGNKPGQFLRPLQRGKYIAVCEGDDYWTDPAKLEIQASFLERNPDFVICYGNSQPFDENGLLDNDFGGARRDLSAIELQRGKAIFTLTAMYRNIIVWPPEFVIAAYGDLCTWSLLGLEGKGRFINEIKPCMYRVHSGGVHSSASKQKRQEMLLRTLAAQLAYFRRVGLDDLADFYKQKLESTAIAGLGIHPRLVPLFVFLSSSAASLFRVLRYTRKLFLAPKSEKLR